jgi:hypothetical protein
MAEPSKEAQARAAETLAKLGGIPGLEGGIAVFRGDELERVRWYEVTREQDRLDGGIRAHVPPVSAYEYHNELIEACRSEIWDGIYERNDAARDVLPHWFELLKKEGGSYGYVDPPRLRQLVGWITDGVAQEKWRARIDAEWPRLSAVGVN